MECLQSDFLRRSPHWVVVSLQVFHETVSCIVSLSVELKSHHPQHNCTVGSMDEKIGHVIY